MDKTKQLENLFTTWMKKQSEETEKSLQKTMIQGTNITKNHFCKDGIICENEYNKQKTKVLFITNEPNIEDNENEPVISSQVCAFLNYYASGVDDWGGKLRLKISKVIFPEIVDDSDKENPYKNAVRFAFMNLNKRGGGKNADAQRVIEYVNKYADFVIQEINIIDPDIIVWLGNNTFDYSFYTTNVLNICQNENQVYYMNIDSKTIPVLRAYHTSARVSYEKRRLNIKSELDKI